MSQSDQSGPGPSGGSPDMLKCYECGADTPVKDGPLCWACRQKASSPGQGSTGAIESSRKVVKTGAAVGNSVVTMAWILLVLGLLGSIGFGFAIPEVSPYGRASFNWGIALSAAFVTVVQFVVLRAFGYVLLLLTVIAGKDSTH